MPGFDGSGPLGKGPMTGRGRGFCIRKIKNLPNESIENPESLEKDLPDHLKRKGDVRDTHPFRPMEGPKDQKSDKG